MAMWTSFLWGGGGGGVEGGGACFTLPNERSP